MTNYFQPKLRLTKIIATLGPATDSPQVLRELIQAGVNVVRLNFSHGTHAEHLQRIEWVREVSRQLDQVVGILADLQGPKIRISRFIQGKVTLEVGQTFILDADFHPQEGTAERVGIDYKDLPRDVKPNDVLVLDDGRIVLDVLEVASNAIICRVKVGGVLSNNKGINRRGGGLSAKALTEKDEEDLCFALKAGVDYIAISFPRNAEDVLEARRLMQLFNGHAAIIAKIERTEAITHIDEIIRASDGVMVARGDLGVEVGDAYVPMLQKEIIHRARALDKPVITATQMMESMIENTIPTRAEVSDVANAVLDHTDAVMLSAETATGAHPVLVVRAMSEACLCAEASRRTQVSGHRVECTFSRVDEAIAMATMYTANHFKVKAIVALTESGATALWMSRIRTGIPIFGLSRHARTLGRLAMYRGVFPIYFDVTQVDRDEVNLRATETLQQCYPISEGDHVILTKGDQAGVGGGANALKILTIGHVN